MTKRAASTHHTTPYARKHVVTKVYKREDGSAIYSVWLKVGVQSFKIYENDDEEAKEGAKFTRRMLAIALTTLIEGAR